MGVMEYIKKHAKAIIALIAVFIFVFEIVAMGFIGNPFAPSLGNGDGAGSTNGVAEFNGALRTYDPLLIVPLDTSETLLSEIREMDGVTSVTREQDSVVIQTETRDDVYPLSLFLKDNNITSYAIANVAMPSVVKVTLQNGSVINATSMTGAVRFVTEPIVDVDREVGLLVSVQVSEGIITGYDQAIIASEEKTINVDGVVLDVNHVEIYTVPWEHRNNITLEEGYEYEKNNLIIFAEPLSMEEIMEKKNLSYVEYIDEYSVQCADDFDNLTRIQNDFGPGIQLPDSELKVTSEGNVSLGYDKTVTYLYTISIPEEADGILLGIEEVELEIDKLYETNSTVEIEISGVVIGNEMVTVNSIEPA